MEKLQYTLIKNITQYNNYCKRVELLLDKGIKTKTAQDEIELLTLLIEKYDEEHSRLKEITDPIQLLKSLMGEAQMKAADMAMLLDVSKGLVSDILNYKKGLSKEIIRKLAEHFKVRQEVFNKPYALQLIPKPIIATRTKTIGKEVYVKRANSQVYSRTQSVSKLHAVKEPIAKYGVSGKKVRK